MVPIQKPVIIVREQKSLDAEIVVEPEGIGIAVKYSAVGSVPGKGLLRVKAAMKAVQYLAM
ncbi:hypothetical protein [Paenibacillus tepidiphilus]|uniref:hypothetical protein n=1 Tax=Paenibacillus tepidiphilus TaxID=2608683 RepID=UPI0012384B01|nr:hypothetical protein [Paenibacillus tepidiphilus]